MRNSFIIKGLIALTCAAMACQQPSKPTTNEVISNNTIKASVPSFALNPPIPNLTQSFQTFTFDASKGTTFHARSGSDITIPKNALTDKNGQLLRGPVSLRYREFQDALSVYLAGIPMNYKGGNFSTAGSFELRPLKNADTLQFVKPATVKMASYTEGSNYDFFKLNDTGNWDSIGYRKPEVNLRKKKLLAANRLKIQRLSQLHENNLFAFNYMAIMDVYYNDNWKILGKDNVRDSAFAAIKNKLNQYDLGYYNCFVDNRQVISFDGYEAPAALWVWRHLTKNTLPEWAKKPESAYGYLNKIEGKRYVLNIESYKDTALKFSTEIEAVMPLKTLFAFTPNDWKTRRYVVNEQIRADQIRVKQMADVYRTFNINQFGLYNWDKMMKEKGNVVVEAQFDFNAHINDKLTTLDVIYISGDNRSVITFPKLSWDKMALMPDDKARLFTVLPDNKIAIFTPQQYAKLDFTHWLTQKKTPQYFFKMTAKTAKTTAELKQLLQI